MTSTDSKKNPAPAATGTRPKNINQIGKAMFQTSIAPTTDNSNRRSQEAWVDQVMNEVNTTRLELENNTEFQEWAASQDDVWTRDDCVSKYITTTRESWPAPERLPAWVSAVDVSPVSYCEVWLRMSHTLRSRSVAVQISLTCDLNIGNGSVTYGTPKFFFINGHNVYEDFTTSQAVELQALLDEALTLVEQQPRHLARNTGPGTPDTEGIGGGL